MVENNIITITRGDDEPLVVNLTDYELQDGDMLVLSVKKTPMPDSELLMQVKSETTGIRLLHEQTKNIPVGKYSYDIELRIALPNGQYYTRTVVPPKKDPNVTDGSGRNWKNFIVNGEVTE